jgi:flagellar biosynthesis/type III secretory pathway M-ring protein FliF/YscJ
MPAFLSQVLSQLKNLWAELTAAQRLIVSAVLMATLVGMAALVWVSTRPSYEPLKTPLSSDELPQVARLFTSEGIDYKTSPAGITVESNDAARAETVLMSNGYTGGGTSDVSGLGSGSMMQPRKISQYILQTHKAKRVEKQIAGMQGVRSALVMMHMPDQTPFVGRKAATTASASVLLRTSDTVEFRRLAVAAAGMVSQGLGIPREDVLVTSNAGDTFMDPTGGNDRGYGGLNDLLKLEMRDSALRTGKAQLLLNEIFPNKARVEVKVSYANTIGSKRELITPSEKVAKSETKYESSSNNTRGDSSGDPSMTGATSGASVASSQSGTNGSTTKQSQSRKEFETNGGTKMETELAPKVDRLNVSLFLDKSLEGQATAITQQVKNLVGWDGTVRKDPEFTAIVTEFPAIDELVDESGGIMQMVDRYGPIAGQILSVALVLFFLKGLLKKTRPAVTASAGGGGSGSRNEEEEAPEDPSKEAKRLRREIERVVASDPGSVTRLLEGWLTEKANT